MGGTPVWSEQAPGQNPNQALAEFQKFVQQVLAVRGAAAPTTQAGAFSPAQGGGPPPQMTGAPSGGSLPPTYTSGAQMPPPAMVPPPKSTMPSNFPNAQARAGGATTSAINGVAEAIFNYKNKKNQDEITRAQNTLNMFQNAMAQGDMQVANMLATDPKVVKSWEKYLKMEFPRVPGAPTSPSSGTQQPQGASQQSAAPGRLPGVNQPGGIAVPRNVQGDMMTAAKLQSEQALAQSRQAEAQKYGAEADKAVIEGNTAYVKAAADFEERQAEAAASRAAENASKAKLASVPLENEKLRSEAAKNYAEAVKDRAQAEKALKEAGNAKSLAAYNAAENHYKTVMTQTASQLKDMRGRQDRAQSTVGKFFEGAPEDTPEMQAKQAELSAQSKAYRALTGMQQQVMDGKMTIEDAQTKARRSAGLMSDLTPWSGMPDKTQKGTAIPAVPPKDFPNGSAITDSNGTVLGVAQDGQWVAP